jgi:hypothetical protein
MPRLLALVLFVTATDALAGPARVLDGDTPELSAGERTRLWGIDAVEGDQICQRNGCTHANSPSGSSSSSRDLGSRWTSTLEHCGSARRRRPILHQISRKIWPTNAIETTEN